MVLKRDLPTNGARLYTILVLLSALAGATDRRHQELVDQARVTVEALTTDPGLKETLGQLGPDAKALFILPDFFRWGFVVGGASGSGVLIVREESTGNWSQPVFYHVGSLNVGAQVGADVSLIIVVVRSKKGVEEFYGAGFKLGGSAGVAARTTGKGASIHGLSAQMVAYARQTGFFAGFALAAR